MIDFIGHAEFSACGNYRYLLTRRWGKRSARARTVCFIGLNPSTADANTNDATVRKCIAIADHLGFDQLKLVNLFAYMATEPKDLKLADNPVGENNDQYIEKACKDSAVVVACWGNHGLHLDRDVDVIKRHRRRLQCLKMNVSGTPAHPLYLPTRSKLEKFYAA